MNEQSGVWKLMYDSPVCLSYQVNEAQWRGGKKRRPQAMSGHALFYRLKSAVRQTKSQIILTRFYLQFQACLPKLKQVTSDFVSSLWLMSPSPGAIRFTAMIYSCFVCVTLQVGGPQAWWIYTLDHHRSSSLWQEYISASLHENSWKITFSIKAFLWFYRLLYTSVKQYISWLLTHWTLTKCPPQWFPTWGLGPWNGSQGKFEG